MRGSEEISQLRGRIAIAGVRQRDVAKNAGYGETVFSSILNGVRRAPPDFEQKVSKALERLERAEKAAQEARERVLAEGA